MDIDEITLVSYEGTEYRVPSLIFNFSSVLNGIPNINEKIHLATVEIDSESLAKIVEYFTHHNYHPPTVLTESSHNVSLYKLLPTWDIDFISSIDDEVLIKLLHCCFRLEISPIFELVCLQIALKFRDIKEIERMLKLKLDLFENNETQIYLKKKYPWAFTE